MKPYYDHAGITIYHGDCREVLDEIGMFNQELVITDPPYGIDYQSARRIDWQRKARIEGDHEFPLWIFEKLFPSIGMFVWCRWDVMRQMPKPKSFIAWDKGNHSMGDLDHEFGRRWEGCEF